MTVQIDIRGTRCPMNLLKVKLALEPLAAGDTLEVLLDPGEGLENVPRALEAAGHQIVKTILKGADAPCTLLIQKGARES